jgi:hypothetical protein
VLGLVVIICKLVYDCAPTSIFPDILSLPPSASDNSFIVMLESCQRERDTIFVFWSCSYFVHSYGVDFRPSFLHPHAEVY